MRVDGLIPRGGVLHAWQAYGFDRVFELRADGRLRFQTVVITISRQQGKSVWARGASWWRIHQGDRFGEEQALVHVANRAKTAREVWRPASQVAVRRYGPKAVKRGKGEEEIDLTEHGHGRWLVQAANEDTGIGFSLSAGLVDEAWNVGQATVDDAIVPAMSEMEQPQLWLVSTAGVDDASDLLRTYRDFCLAAKQAGDEDVDVLLLEWSAAPEWAWDDPVTWRWASPHWTVHRQEYLQSQMVKAKSTAKGESAFRRQYLNQWTAAENPWIPPGVWALGFDDSPPPGRPPDAVAVEVSPERDRFGLVAVWRLDDGALYATGRAVHTTPAVWDLVDAWQPRTLILAPQLHLHYRGRRKPVVAGSTEISTSLTVVQEAIRTGMVRHHPADAALNDDLARTQAIMRAAGLTLSNRGPSERTLKEGVARPIDCARALVWAVGELLRPGSPKPMIRSA